jgi:hypothetical protein
LGGRWLTGDLQAYIYRVWPRIDKQQDKVYLSIVQEPVDEEYLLRSFGSGRYLVMVKDRGKLLRKHAASVHNRDYPGVRDLKVSFKPGGWPSILKPAVELTASQGQDGVGTAHTPEHADCLQREPITVLHPASMTPAPTNRCCRRNSG